jgi:hypothetical protein
MKNFLIVCALGLLFAGASYADKPIRFKAQLEGFDLTGAPVATAATGQARVEVIDDGSALAFRVNIEDFDNLLMAHIHVADTPVMVTDPSGPPVYWFNGGPPPGATLSETLNGRLAEGYIFTPGQLDSPRADVTTVEELIAAIAEGRASVIIHSSDFPRGELRGTLE